MYIELRKILFFSYFVNQNKVLIWVIPYENNIGKVGMLMDCFPKLKSRFCTLNLHDIAHFGAPNKLHTRQRKPYFEYTRKSVKITGINFSNIKIIGVWKSIATCGNRNLREKTKNYQNYNNCVYFYQILTHSHRIR